MTEPPDAENFSSDAVRSVTALTLVSRVLGLARDVAMAAVFGGGPVFDAFTLAFRVPNLFRRWFGEGAFSLAVIPALTRVASRQGPAARDRLATALVLFASGVTALIAVVTFCGLTGLVGSGVFAAGRDRLWADYVRILIWYLPLICATAQLSAVLQTAGRFAAAAFVPVVLNLSWLATLAVWLGLAGSRGESATLGGALCCAIVVSGLLQLAVVSGDCFRSRVWIRLPGRTDWGRARRIVAGAPAAVAAVGITQVNVVVDAIFAWWAAPVGAVSALYFGQRLYEFPIGVFALAVGAVIFPAMASREADGDRPGLGRTTADGLRLVAFLGMPAAVGLVLVARPLVTLFFRYGAFSDADAGRTAAVVVALAVGVLPGMLLPILQRAHLAVGATGRCVRFPVIAVVANAVLDGPAAWL
ncbi:MAG: murein biosynthesis integral membrane protein MurJ, partial [Planctomycetota bacterium]